MPFIELKKPSKHGFIPLDKPDSITDDAMMTAIEDEPGYDRQAILESIDIPQAGKEIISGERSASGIPRQAIDRSDPNYTPSITSGQNRFLDMVGIDINDFGLPGITKVVKGLPLKVIRIEEKGSKLSKVDKPQGLYTSPSEFVSPHAELGGVKKEFNVNQRANILKIDTSGNVQTNRGFVAESAGIGALRSIVGDVEYDRLAKFSKKSLREELSNLYPNVKWDKYYDQQEMLEGYAGLLAREKGYDAIWAIDKLPEFNEYVALTDNAFLKMKKGEDIPKYAGSVNLNRQVIADEAKRLEVGLFEKHGFKTKVTHEQVIEDAQKIFKKFQDDPKFYRQRIEAIKGGATPTVQEEVAHRIANATDFQKLQQMSKAAAKGEIPIDEFKAFESSVRDRSLSVANPLAAEAGRRLNTYNIMVGKDRAFKAIGRLKKGMNDRQRKLFEGLDLENPQEVERFVKDLPNPKLKDYFYEYWYNSILSGIPTHIVNIASNTAWRMFQVPHRALTGAIDLGISKFGKRQRQVFASEAIPMMAGMLKGKGKGIKRAWDTARHGRIQEFETKWAKEMDSALGAFDRAPNKAVRAIGKVITPPSKALRAMDVYANTLAYDAQVNALAKRAWIQKGKPGKFNVFNKRFAENLPKWAHDDAMDFAKYTTFMSDPGKISEAIMTVRRNVPGTRLFIPFVNTVGNLFKRGIEMTPGLGLTLAKGQKPAEVAAKQLEGSVLAMLTIAKVHKGEIVGDVPQDPNERAAFYRQGKKPWSIKVGDQYVEFRRIEPFNTVLAATSIAYKNINKLLDEGNEEEATKVFSNLTNEFKNNLIDSSYLSGVSEIFNRHGKLEKVPSRMASSLVPYSGFWRSVNRSAEAYFDESAKVYDHRDMMASFAGVIPGLYKLREPKLNVWGKDIELQGGVFRQWLPYRWSEETDDPTEHFLEKVKVYPGIPGQRVKIDGKTQKLNDDIYRKYAIDYGSKLKLWLDNKVGLDIWKQWSNTEGGRERIQKKINSKSAAIRSRALKRAIREQKQRR